MVKVTILEPYVYCDPEFLSRKMDIWTFDNKMEFQRNPLNLEFHEKIKQNLMFLETGKGRIVKIKQNLTEFDIF